MIIDETDLNEILNDSHDQNTNTTNQLDLPLIESWIDFSECALLHQSSQFIPKSSNHHSTTTTSTTNTTQDHSTSPSTSSSASSLTSPFCDHSSFLTLSPPPVSLNDPLPITRTEYGLIDEFWSQISTGATTDQRTLRTSENDDELLRFVVQAEEEEEGLRRNRSIQPIETKLSQSRIDPLLLSIDEVHPIPLGDHHPFCSSSSSNIKLDQVDSFLNKIDPLQYHPQPQPQSQNEYIVYEGFDRIPETQSPTQSISSSTHSSIPTQPNPTSKESNQNHVSRGGKRKDFLERNRLAASRSRAKRKQTETGLESKARGLEDQNVKLRSVVQELEIELRQLKEILFDVRMIG
ncbi:uncharacterized protein MELLADRAFT_115177 [Melampsora larici-populina 98AG31]|uniref:BZIP domain-containing protein n=1 Tax=Melampsora larici-populina (strain 98AG31 / pathotype 3-4-7) TaxID=747676 RepID=F4R7B1_MELLP|nr:uncharacterized protein MELLADRAFT_115177 [Melampsora larici-populina 98AG31]EGG11282.1 hypothetical protein MELLADRAFT_115177 [Melampsora larici-populina 98AG31]